MERKTKTRTMHVLIIMNVLAWIAFIGLSIKAGAMLFSYGVSCFNPEGAKNMYEGLNLYDLSQFGFWHYTTSVSFMVGVLAMKAFVCFLVIKTLSKMNLMNPFTVEVARVIENIGYVLVGAGAVSILNNVHSAWLLKRTGTLYPELDSGELLFMAGLVFIISQIFKRGVEIQSENDLTV